LIAYNFYGVVGVNRNFNDWLIMKQDLKNIKFNFIIFLKTTKKILKKWQFVKLFNFICVKISVWVGY